MLAAVVAGCGHAQSHDVGSGCATIETGSLVKRLAAAGLRFSVLPVKHASYGEVAQIATLRPADAAVTGFLDLGVFKTCGGARQRAKHLSVAAPGRRLLYGNLAGVYAAETPSGVKTTDHFADIVRAIRSAGTVTPEG